MLNIVLYEPLIPQNTGNIIRTCVGVNAKLHLIEPLGFSLDEKHLKRSALDYYKYLNYQIYSDFAQFKKINKGQYYFITRYGKKIYTEIKFKNTAEEIYLIFGKETTGVDRKLLSQEIDKTYRIPTNDKIRSLNLSNSVSIVVYEYLRQNDFLDLEIYEPATLKGKDYLDSFLSEEE